VWRRNNYITDGGLSVSEHTTAINKLYKLARKFKPEIRGLSQVGEVYDKSKFQYKAVRE